MLISNNYNHAPVDGYHGLISLYKYLLFVAMISMCWQLLLS